MKRLDGKKLLIVSSDSSDISFVEAAKSLGAYVICCDRYTDYKISPPRPWRMKPGIWTILTSKG